MRDKKAGRPADPLAPNSTTFSADPLVRGTSVRSNTLAKVQTKAGPTSSSDRDSPNQGLYGQWLDLDRERRRKKKTGMQDTRQERGRRTITKQSLRRSGPM